MTKNKEGSFRVVFIFMIVTLFIAGYWDKWAWMKNSIHSVLDPTIGSMLGWNLDLGMLVVSFIISAFIVVIQKFTTNQEELRKIKNEQKELQTEMKKMRNHPEKMADLQKKQFALMPRQMKLTMRTVIYTGIPLILFFRWFNDYFLLAGSPKIFGFMGWFWFYLISTMVFSSILKKKFDVV